MTPTRWTSRCGLCQRTRLGGDVMALFTRDEHARDLSDASPRVLLRASGTATRGQEWGPVHASRPEHLGRELAAARGPRSHRRDYGGGRGVEDQIVDTL